MQNSFTVARSRCSDLTDPGLREEILHATGSDDHASAILRCLERFGFDASILRYEIAPRASQRGSRGSATASWTVSAVRSQ